MSKSRVLSIILLLFTAIVVFGACTNQNSQNSSTTTPSAGNTNAATAPSPAVAMKPGAKLNINTATGAELLAAIPNLGNRMVHEFEEYRPYSSIQQFRREIGKYVSPEQVAEYEKYIFVPINPSEADAPTLQQIPGLDATEAQALVAARPYASADAFLSKLSDMVSAAELEVAKSYVSAK
jgi:DNA uptake protein ComE-like DNA-binding protein